MQPQAANFEASAALAGVDSRSLALLTLRISLRLPHLSNAPPIGQLHFMALQTHGTAHTHTNTEMSQKTCKKQEISEI